MHSLALCIHDILNLLEVEPSSQVAAAVRMRLEDFQRTTLAQNKQAQLKRWQGVSAAFVPHKLVEGKVK